MPERLSGTQMRCLRYARDVGHVHVTPEGDAHDPSVFPVRTVVSLVRQGYLEVNCLDPHFHGYRITDKCKDATNIQWEGI